MVRSAVSSGSGPFRTKQGPGPGRVEHITGTFYCVGWRRRSRPETQNRAEKTARAARNTNFNTLLNTRTPHSGHERGKRHGVDKLLSVGLRIMVYMPHDHQHRNSQTPGQIRKYVARAHACSELVIVSLASRSHHFACVFFLLRLAHDAAATTTIAAPTHADNAVSTSAPTPASSVSNAPSVTTHSTDNVDELTSNFGSKGRKAWKELGRFHRRSC